MRILVHVKPGKREERVEKTGEMEYTVFIKAQPEKGRANDAVLKVLARTLKIPVAQLKITSGKTSRIKTILIT